MEPRQTYAMVGIDPVVHKRMKYAALYHDMTMREIVETAVMLYVNILDKQAAQKQQEQKNPTNSHP